VIFNNIYKSVAQGAEAVPALWSLGMRQSRIRLQLGRKGAIFRKDVQEVCYSCSQGLSLTRLFYKHLNMLGTCDAEVTQHFCPLSRSSF